MVKLVWIFNTERGGKVELRVHGKDALSQVREGMGKIADRARFCNALPCIDGHALRERNICGISRTPTKL